MHYKKKYPLIKAFFVRTPAHRLLLEIKGVVQNEQVSRAQTNGGTKAYCISPYRSGTTYISRLFAPNHRVRHEPLRFITLKQLDNPAFLAQRARFLNLDLESSGCFANRLAVLRRFAPDAPVLFLSRDPEIWIGSILNYFPTLSRRIHYNYIARLFFDPICHVPIDRFYTLTPPYQERLVRSLLEFWLSVYETASKDPNVLMIPIDTLDERIAEVESFFGLKAMRHTNIDRNANPNKRPLIIRDHLNVETYRHRVAALGYSL